MPWTFSGQEVCGYCGCWFDVHLYGPAPKWCSSACRQAAYRERNGIGGLAQPHRRTSDHRRDRARLDLMSLEGARARARRRGRAGRDVAGNP